MIIRNELKNIQILHFVDEHHLNDAVLDYIENGLGIDDLTAVEQDWLFEQIIAKLQ